jgi:hypothetical protein
MEDVKKSMGGFLQYVGTLKGLASIRDAIWELLNPVIINPLEPIQLVRIHEPQCWSTIILEACSTSKGFMC